VHTLVLIQDIKPCLARVFNSKHHSPEALAHSINQTIIGFKQRTGLDAVFDIFIDYETEDAEPHDFRKALEKSLKSLSGLRTDEPDDRKPITLEKTDPSFLAAKIVPDKRIHCLFNFCKGKFGSSSFIDTYMLQISIVLILAFLSFAVSIASIHMDISRLETRIAEIDARAVVIFNTSFPATKKIQDPFLQMKANVQAAMKKSAPAGGSSQSVKTITMVDIMGELSKKIAPSTDMEISSFFFNEGRLVLSGSTNNFNTVDNIKSSIESSDWFKRVSISSAAADKQGDRVNFKFIMEM
jgi:general secretion pathway protein L